MAAPFMNKLSQLYRDPDRGWLFGVVAGLCQTFGWRVRLTRVILNILAVFFGLFGVLAVAYLAAVILLPTLDEVQDDRPPPQTEKAQRRNATMHQRYADIGARLDTIERHLHSAEARLRREFADLEGNSAGKT